MNGDSVSLGGLVSYIVPMYNAESYVSECVRTIYHQTYRPIQVIFVNDGSTDRTVDILESEISRLNLDDIDIRVIQQANMGTGAARNAGLSVATGDWIGFLDIDDLLPPMRTSWLLQAAVNAGADLAYGRTIRFSNVQELSWPREDSVSDSPERVEVGNQLVRCVPGQTQFLARKDVLRRISGYHPDLRMVDEFEFIVRLRACNPVMVRIERVVYGYRSRLGSSTSLGVFVRLPWALRSHELILESFLLSGRDEYGSRKVLRSMFLRDARHALWVGRSDLLVRSLRGWRLVSHRSVGFLIGVLVICSSSRVVIASLSRLVRVATRALAGVLGSPAR